MADLNTSQKAPFTVTDANGADITNTLNDSNLGVSGTSITAHIDVEQQTAFITAQEAGDSTLTVTKAGQSGVLLVSVSEGGLTITLGTPVPK